MLQAQHAYLMDIRWRCIPWRTSALFLKRDNLNFHHLDQWVLGLGSFESALVLVDLRPISTETVSF